MRIALAQTNPTVGDIAANTAAITARAREAAAAGADLVIFPELAISGYPPRDLVLAPGFVKACEAAARNSVREASHGITIVVGLVMSVDAAGDAPHTTNITNSLLAFRDGRELARYDKRLLPTYDVFDEDRYFTPGSRPVVIDVPTRTGGVARVGLAICEDLWKGEDAGFADRYRDAPNPVAELANAGAQVIAVPSASPFVLGKGRRHREILARHARERSVWVASVNQVGGNDDLLFDGHAAVYAPGGTLVAAGPGFRESLVLSDLEAAAPPSAFTPIADPLLTTPDDELLFRALVLGVRDYCRKTGFTTALLGLSGGIDSAVTACLAAAALGPDNVTCVALPGPYSSDHSVTDALELAAGLGTPFINLPIEAPMAGFRSALDTMLKRLGQPALGEKLPDLAEENLQSRIRGTALMALSNRTGAILLTTGNKSELAVGYCTLYGDMNGGLAVLSDVTKQLVYRLARWMNAHPRDVIPGFAGAPPLIPLRTIEKAPSAELRPNQTDQDSLPPYDLLDAIIEASVERHMPPAAIIESTGADGPTVARVLRMIDLAEYKRKQTAVGLKVTTVAFGSGRRMPIAHRWKR